MRRFLLACTALSLALASPLCAEPRSLTDDTGRAVTLPAHPERVVVLHEPLLGVPLADLGLAPIGSFGRGDAGESLMAVDFYTAVLGAKAPRPAGLGPLGALDPERIGALHPDLILGTEYNRDDAEQLARIAPVYLQASSTGRVRGFEAEEALAKVVGREAAWAARLEDYRRALAQTRARLPGDPAGQSYLAIFLTDQINAVGRMSGAVQALEDLGYRPLEVPRATGSGLGSTLIAPLSAEIFLTLDPDLLVVMGSYTGAARDAEGIRATLARIAPGWERFIPAARTGRVLFLDSARVTTPTVASAELTLEAVAEWSEEHAANR